MWISLYYSPPKRRRPGQPWTYRSGTVTRAHRAVRLRCKSHVSRCLNRMNDEIPGTRINKGLPDGYIIYQRGVDQQTASESSVGWCFQRPNLFLKCPLQTMSMAYPRIHGENGSGD